MLLQSDDSAAERNSEAKEKEIGNCEFDKSLEGMGLQPISFILRSSLSPLEKSSHIFVVEASTVRWFMGNFRKYLWGSEFLVLSDCSGLQKIFESEANAHHMVHMWRSELFQCQFVTWHFPASII